MFSNWLFLVELEEDGGGAGYRWWARQTDDCSSSRCGIGKLVTAGYF